MRRAVIVEKDDGSLDRWRLKLKRLGLEKTTETQYAGTVEEGRQLHRIKLFCAAQHARFYYDDPDWTRNTDYREIFFASFPPNSGDRYLCAYCGRRLKKDDVTVDHIYPVSKAASSIRIQEKLRRKGLTGINDIKNLTPACAVCNERKSAKTNMWWMIRGVIGRNSLIWKIRKTVRTAVFLAALAAAAGVYTGRIDPMPMIRSIENVAQRAVAVYIDNFFR